MDNTLPQAADSWVRGYGSSASRRRRDPFAPKAFIAWVDAFIDAPALAYPLPGEIKSGAQVDEPFIKLWQEHTLAASVREYAADALLQDQRQRVAELFVDAVQRFDRHWVDWILFQWTPQIFNAYDARMWKRWPKELPEAASELTRMIAAADYRAQNTFAKLTRSLKTELETADRPQEYEELAAAERISLPHFALAYAFNWYSRGASYSMALTAHPTRFHFLRRTAPEARGQGCSFELSSKPFSWGAVFQHYIASGVMDRDVVVIAKALSNLRHLLTPHVRREVQRRYEAASERAEDSRSAHVYRKQIGDLLDAVGHPPPLRRRSGTRLKNAAKGAQVALQITSHADPIPPAGRIAAIAGQALARVVRPSHKLIRRVAWRTLHHSPRVWQWLEIPGVTSEVHPED